MKTKHPVIESFIQKNLDIFVDLGCGNCKETGYIGIDSIETQAVDIVHDLNQPLSFIPDSCVSRVKSHHCLEHLDNFVALMEEVFRICKPNAVIEITVPHFSNPYYYSDPTHKRFFGVYSMNYFSPTAIQPTDRRVPTHYSKSLFKINSIKISLLKRSLLRRLFNPFLTTRINKDIKGIERYEKCLAWKIPADSVSYVLTPLK